MFDTIFYNFPPFDFIFLRTRIKSPEVTETEVRKEDAPRTMEDAEEMTKDEAGITIHVTIITRDGTEVINTDTMTLVLVGMIDDEVTNTATIDPTKIVATLTGVVADILNLTNTNVQIAMTDVTVVDHALALPRKKNVIRATALIQSPKRRNPQT